MMPAFGELNERTISMEEVMESVNEINSGMAAGLDGFPVPCSKKRGMGCIAVLEWLARLLNVSFDMGVVPIWTGVMHVWYIYTRGNVTSMNAVIVVRAGTGLVLTS